MTPSEITLVLGGTRSGKSCFAESLIAASAQPIYLATAEPRDGEMTARIAAHRARRGPAWRTVEAPLALPEVLPDLARPDSAVLVDCLTLWLSNLLAAGHDIADATARLIAALDRCAGRVVLVSNEVGLGIVPDNALARAFRDHAGALHQAVAGRADTVYFVAAGLPLVLKGIGSRAP
ncbi:MAG: bifunctional adenosylcobinamide kinase/adenosylcobinamide-phosphate guanylyltransferase [Azospirillum sp.]|nr:bifunctional adenosylcobinamide kinase/adenosylcobinamide-phosphate guanylyltransferase [Azospirillum sp.]